MSGSIHRTAATSPKELCPSVLFLCVAIGQRQVGVAGLLGTCSAANASLALLSDCRHRGAVGSECRMISASRWKNQSWLQLRWNFQPRRSRCSWQSIRLACPGDGVTGRLAAFTARLNAVTGQRGEAEDRAAATSSACSWRLARWPIRFSRRSRRNSGSDERVAQWRACHRRARRDRAGGTRSADGAGCRACQHVIGRRPERSRVSLLTVELVVAMGLVDETALMADGSC